VKNLHFHRHILQQTAVEVHLADSWSLLFNFPSKSVACEFANCLLNLPSGTCPVLKADRSLEAKQMAE